MTKVCACGTLMFRVTGQRRYCSDQCKRTAYRRRKGIPEAPPRKYDMLDRAKPMPKHDDVRLAYWPCRTHGAPLIWGWCGMCVKEVDWTAAFV